MILSQISGMALLIWESNDIAEDKSSSSYPKIRWPLDLICPSMFILLKMNQWCQRSMLFSDGKFSESISSGPTISSTPRRSFLQDNVYMEQGYREASGGSFCILDYHTDVLESWSIHGFHPLNVWSVCNNHETVKVLFDTQDIKIHYSQIKICCPTRV